MKRFLSLFLLLTVLAGIFAGCAVEDKKDFQSAKDFEQAKIGVMTGSVFNSYGDRYFPEAKLYHMNMANLILNLKQEKIDGILMDKAFFAPLIWGKEELSFIELDMPATEYAVAFAKDAASDPLVAQINTFIRTQTENGWLAQQEKKWFSGYEPDGTLDLSQLTGENGTLRVAATVDSLPFDYLQNEQYSGFDADFIFRFAKEYGYALDIDLVAFEALLPGLSTQRYDLALSGITVTEERKESMLFSDVYYKSPIIMAVLRDKTATDTEKTLADYQNASIGIITGSSHDGTAKKYLPHAQRVYFNNMADMILAVEQGKIDGYLEDAPFLAPLIWEGMALKRLDEAVSQVCNGFVFPQGGNTQLRQQMNEFIAAAKSDETLEHLIQKWLADTEPTQHPDYSQLTGENGTIHLAISVDNKPMLYQNADGYTGLEMELLTLFAQRYGYRFEIEVVPFESIIAGVSSNKYDIGASSLNITAEREESVDFSEPYASFDAVLVTKNDGASESSKSLAEFENATIGVMTGTVYDDFAKERFPNAKREYYNLISDMIVAVEQEKIDGYLSESSYVTAAIWEGAQIQPISEVIDRTQAGFIFQKGEATAQLREQINAFVLKSKENGTLDGLKKKWFSPTEPTEKLDYSVLTGENGTIKVAVAPELKPISYIKDGQLTGYEMELLLLFAQEYGYQLDMSHMTFDAILPGVTTGKHDIGTGGITITEERAESLSFSESHLTVDVVMVVHAQTDSAVQTGFWEELKEDFHKTFIRENRWKLIVQGIGVTMLISTCATISGTVLGFGLYMLSRSDKRALRVLARGIAKVYSRIIAGTPVVVILMILFYVIFGNIRDMSGIVVAIVGFTLTFGAFVFDHMTVSVSSVDRGQTEAAYALGYPKNKTFFRIILPQAMTFFLPSYCGQAVELIKATAVVGYVAVNDLTKMGDIIRSNTYEAFFPLIAIAVIYFLLTWMLSAVLAVVKRRFEPKRRTAEKILKGVETK